MEEKLNKTYKIAIAALIISIICLVLILGSKISIKDSSSSSSSSTTDNTTTNNEYDVSSFKTLTLQGVVDLFSDKKNTYVVYLGRPSCSACVSFLPTLKSMQNKYGYVTQYLDIETVKADDTYDKFISLLDKEVTLTVNGETKTQSFGKFFGYTPMTFIIKKGKFADGIVGTTSESSFESFLNRNGIK